MNSVLHKVLIAFLLIMIVPACDQDPKVITQESSLESENGTGIFNEEQDHSNHKHNPSSIESQTHSVVVKEVLPTSKYVYMLVVEGDKEYWLATAKREVKVGGTYFFRDGLLKTNFESKEYNRVFSEIYLVSKFVEANHGGGEEIIVEKTVVDSKVKEGSISISDLLSDPRSHAGRTVQVSGECTKINRNIMGRNWVHLNDGSSNSANIVVTSDNNVAIGQVVTMRAKVAVGKDFGAGYKYDIILEEGVVVK